ncbi:ATP-binding cassette domain-containing protein [Brevundimonas sp. PAMC22021]|uniref:ATP-binding cassette domain-containing protein n=1 Tax=Brevundimonas sp. PAMC22021 TaxID=2861285 RepID=UPI001C625FD6|nr:ATP-binding cassette domain-containing protein [Brevundimonas sp. PAMC22021]QYF87394.1 ATP-binding cassette domain-containing protein [Brevundimonas sp. PAMC22021]
MSIDCHVVAERGGFRIDATFQTDRKVLALVGPSGGGKTTLLHALAGLLAPQRLRLRLDSAAIIDTDTGLNPPSHQRRIGYVFQDGRLFPHMTVGDNIAFGRRFAPDPVPVAPILDMLDLKGFERRWPASLSGGEMRRVAIARALCSDPRLLLLDEPFSGLDTGRRDALIPYIARLRDAGGTPIILVSHDPRDIAAIAEDVVRMDRGGIV